MSDPRACLVRGSFSQVQEILHRDWDPIGSGVPLDEYDSCVWPVVKMLAAQAGRDVIERYLRDAAAGLNVPVPEARLKMAVDHLMLLKVG